jgi:hypothetical protein
MTAGFNDNGWRTQVQRGDEPSYIKPPELAPRRDLQCCSGFMRSFPKGNRAQSRIGNGPISVGYPAHKDARPERDRRGPSSALSGCRNVLGSPRGHLAVAEPRVVTGDLQEIRIDKPRVQAVRRDLESKSSPA